MHHIHPQISYQTSQNNPVKIPLYTHAVCAGFPSPADDYMDKKLDLNSYLVQHPTATYFMRAKNNAMIGSGIFKGDLLIVDKSLTAYHNAVIIAEYEGDLILRRLHIQHKHASLVSSNENYGVIHISDTQDLCVWGVVTHIIHKV